MTFLNIPQPERQGADIQSKVEELEVLNQAMRDHDKLKDDAIAYLSDQLFTSFKGKDLQKVKNSKCNRSVIQK